MLKLYLHGHTDVFDVSFMHDEESYINIHFPSIYVRKIVREQDAILSIDYRSFDNTLFSVLIISRKTC